MSETYDQEQERLLRATAQLFQTSVELGAQLLYKPPPVEVSMSSSSDPGLAQGNGQEGPSVDTSQQLSNPLQPIAERNGREGPSVDGMRQDRPKTAAEDAQDAKKALQEGTPQEEVFQSIREGKVAQRIAESGGDADKYAHLIIQKAEIDQAVEMMPNSQAPTQARTPRKSLS